MSADAFRIAARHSANPDAALYRREARERTGLAAREAWSRYQGARRFRRNALRLARKGGMG